MKVSLDTRRQRNHTSTVVSTTTSPSKTVGCGIPLFDRDLRPTHTPKRENSNFRGLRSRIRAAWRRCLSWKRRTLHSLSSRARGGGSPRVKGRLGTGMRGSSSLSRGSETRPMGRPRRPPRLEGDPGCAERPRRRVRGPEEGEMGVGHSTRRSPLWMRALPSIPEGRGA